MKFELTDAHKAELKKLANSGMTPIVIAQRAKILLKKAEGASCTSIAKELERVHIKRASKIIANIMTERKIESSLS